MIGKNIRKRRCELGMSQEDLAKKVGIIGRSYVSKIETGALYPSIKTLKKIAKALNVDWTELAKKGNE